MLSDTEAEVVRQLQKERVADATQLARRLQLSSKTVHRALNKVGYFCSINARSAFVTLAEIPGFDERGLWLYDNRICFSRHRNLVQTLRALIEQSDEGRTLEELQAAVRTRVHNQLSHLQRQGHIRHFYLGRHTVYTSTDEKTHLRQRQRRLEQPRAVAQTDAPTSLLPPDTDALTVIRLLVRLLGTPDASIASLSKSLQAQQVAVNAEKIRRILDFYGLKKTTHSKQRP